MKKLILFALVSSLLVFACKKPAKDEAFGFSLLYMPQAVLQSAGIGNNFVVTINQSNTTDTSIVVGLYRSGLEQLNAVSVDLGIDQDSLARTITLAQQPNAPANLALYQNAKLLPQSYYTLPTKLSLTDGEREAYVLLKINKALLESDPDFGVKDLILPVRISNPTSYKLNPKLSLTMFIFRKK